MKRGNILVEQVLKDGSIIEDYDISLSRSEIGDVVCRYFPKLQKGGVGTNYFIGEYKGHKYAIRCKNVTYLGNPHPIYKKRIQIAEDLYPFYHAALSLGAEPILLGIYASADNLIFVDFRINTYIEKKAHNSSAHIYSSDLQAATVDDYFEKVDYFGNRVTAFKPERIQVFLDDFFGIGGEKETISRNYVDEISCLNRSEYSNTFQIVREENSYYEITQEDPTQQHMVSYVQMFKEQIVPELKNFFGQVDKRWYGIDCYKKMIETNYKNKYQPEWVGFFLEYIFEKYIEENNLKSKITYYQDKSDGGIDLDLYFPQINSFGDLKAHSDNSRGIQGNDWNTVFSILNRNDETSHIYYVVCEHSTQKDSECNYEVTRFWNTEQNKDNLLSYHTRMKNNVTLKKVYILDINYQNKEYLSMFKQGINSNGKPRAPKIMIEQDKLSYFILEEISL